MTRVLFISALLIFASQAFAKNIKIEITTDDQNCPVDVHPDDACSTGSEDVCVGKGQAHFITWKYKGRAKGKPNFKIVMKNNSHHGIFTNGCRKSSKSIKCRVSESAPAGSYAYSIVNSVCTHDPRIIIN
jgi:hypothetical protein